MIGDFSALVFRAAEDHSEWRAVLEALIAASGARIGVISLRDIDSAGLSFPEEASTSLSAPLIVGIEPDFVASYFEHFHALDLWTEIEKSYYPHTPYFMSEHLKLEDLRETEFFQAWLEPQGISECLVAEVHLAKSHWVALNLLFDTSAESRRSEILSHLETALPIMRAGWQLSERVLGLSYAQAASSSYLEASPIPCMILNEDFGVVAINTHGLAEFCAHLPLSAPLTTGLPLVLRNGPVSAAFKALLTNPGTTRGVDTDATVDSERAGYVLHASILAHGTDVVGKRRSQILVVAKPRDVPPSRKATVIRIWETPGLTPAQAAVVRWIAEGGHAPDYAARTGISRKTAYDHLFSARQKLGGISARDIYTSHQAQLAIKR